jgi:hypothetical protein
VRQIITSMDLPGSTSSGGGGSGQQQQAPAAASSYITLLASTRQLQLPGRPSAFQIRIPKLDAYFTGTGEGGAPIVRGGLQAIEC